MAFALVAALLVAGGGAFWYLKSRAARAEVVRDAAEPALVTEGETWCDQIFGPHVTVTDSDGRPWAMQAGAILLNANMGLDESASVLKNKGQVVRSLAGAAEAIRLAAEAERAKGYSMADTLDTYHAQALEVADWAEDVILRGSKAAIPRNGITLQQGELTAQCYRSGYEFQMGRPEE
jgi:hypothetical protein